MSARKLYREEELYGRTKEVDNPIGAKYFVLQMDLDGSYYHDMRKSVIYWNSARKSLKRKDRKTYDSIQAVFDKYVAKIDTIHSFYVLGNYFCFTWLEKTFYTSLSDFQEEELYIQAIMREIKDFGVTDMCYLNGRLD